VVCEGWRVLESESTTVGRGATPLRQLLQDPEAGGRPGVLDAFRAARRTFLAGRRLDMTALAEQLDVNRVTLYRWVGSREDLLVEVIWSLAEPTLVRLRREVPLTGSERIVQVQTRFMDAVLTNPGMATFLAEEGELAMRILTRWDTGFQPRLIADAQAMLEEETASGALAPLPADLRDVAFAIVRIIESYIYLDRITGEEPDTARAEQIFRLLLR
jgi:AcrR family transcriptional regulator